MKANVKNTLKNLKALRNSKDALISSMC